MILFATNYDEPTRACYAIAVRIGDLCTVPLLGENARRESLVEALQNANLPLVALSHGSRETLVGHAGEDALVEGDSHLFRDRVFFAFACHTATTLGKTVASAGGTWWGYTGSVSAPPENDSTPAIFDPIFSFAFQSFHTASSAGDRQRILTELKDMCFAAERNLSTEAIVDLDSLMCLLHIWDRLRVWSPEDRNQPEKHPDSSTPTLIP